VAKGVKRKTKADRDFEKSLAKRLNKTGQSTVRRPRPRNAKEFREAGEPARQRRRTDKRNANILGERSEGIAVAELAAKYCLDKSTIRSIILKARRAGKLRTSSNPDGGQGSATVGKGLGAYLGGTPPEDAKGAAYERAAEIGRRYMANALLRLVELAELDQIDDEGRLKPLSVRADQRVVVVAVRDYLNRVVGTQPIKDPEVLSPTRAKFDPSLYTPEQLAQIEQALRMVAAAQAKAKNDL
jgi:hypothetical protein